MSLSALYDQLAALPAKERDTLMNSLGYTKKRVVRPSKSATSSTLYSPNAVSFGPTSSELEAWLAAHHDPAFKAVVRLPAPGKPAKLTAGRFKAEEEAWNRDARRLWKERGIEVP